MSTGLVLWGVKSIYYVLDNTSGKEYKCVIKGKILDYSTQKQIIKDVNPIVSGDYVEFEVIDEVNGHITKRVKRKNEFKRFKNNAREVQVIVANVDYLMIVDSIDNPELRPFFIDRCLFSCDYLNIEPIIVFNKIDLLNDKNKELYITTKEIYQKLGYRSIETSIITGQGLDELKNILTGKIISLNGRSGVGKSSLIKTCFPEFSDIKIGTINQKFNNGRHTTTHSKIYVLNSNGMIVDTPGIRELSIYIEKLEDLEIYFKDFNKFRSKCKYPNCQHINEPECQVIKAVEKGKIPFSRYDSYLRIRETI